MNRIVYLDNHATTPVDPRVLEAMLPYFSEKYGNPSSRHHAYGWEAEHAVEKARRQVAALVGASPEEIVFTSGATESNNLVFKGLAALGAGSRSRVVTVATEHKSVLEPCQRLRDLGFEVVILPVQPDGLVDLNLLAAAIDDRTLLVSVMHANNEIGVIQPIREIGRLARKSGALFHTDAVQSAGKIPIDVDKDNIDLLSLSAHKMYGPKGVGALYIRRKGARVTLAPLLEGGGQENGLRAGTLNVPGIVGLGAACAICQAEMDTEAERLRLLRDRLRSRIESSIDGVRVNGSWERRLPNNLNMSFEYATGESLLMEIQGVAVSSGSACTSASAAPSHVLLALGLDKQLARSSIRFGLGRFNTEEDIDYAAEKVIQAVRRLRRLSPLYRLLEPRDR